MIISIFLVYVILLLLILIGTHYFNLILSKEEFTRADITNLSRFFNQLWSGIKNTYPLSVFIFMILASSIIGILIPSVIQHWFTNSSILFLCVYFIFPLLKKYYEQSQVTTSENYSDTAVNIFVRYNSVIIIGFGAGTGAVLLYHIRTMEHIHTLWLLINLIILIIFMGILIRNNYLTDSRLQEPAEKQE